MRWALLALAAVAGLVWWHRRSLPLGDPARSRAAVRLHEDEVQPWDPHPFESWGVLARG